MNLRFSGCSIQPPRIGAASVYVTQRLQHGDSRRQRRQEADEDDHPDNTGIGPRADGEIAEEGGCLLAFRRDDVARRPPADQHEHDRRPALQRFAVSREIMQEVSEDIFAMAAAEGWQDPVSRKALQFIERRQRNRGAIDKSPYDSLEHAIAEIERQGMGRESVAEIAYLSGINPLTGAKILGDPGGEPVAILCKATGLDREYLTALWRSMKRPETLPDGSVHPTWERVQVTFEMLAVDRAQTVLRYWNWSLTSAMTPALLKAIREGDTDELDEYSIPERAAMMALAQDFGR